MSFDLSRSESWRGVWTALVTPLTPNLELDASSLKTLIEDQIRGGVAGLVIGGSTGEGSLLRPAVFERLLQATYDASAGRVPLVAGLGIGGTEACLRNIEIARRLGYHGVLASPPAYVRAPQRALVTHFLRLATEGLPLCLYEIPGRAASSLENATILEIIRHRDPAAKNIVALKDASAELARPAELKRALGTRLALLSGDDFSFAGYLAQGGDGAISVVSHVALASMKRILEFSRQAKASEAAVEQKRILPLNEGLFRESNPIPLKSLLAARGKIAHATFSPPLVPMDPSLLAELVTCASTLGDSS